MQPGKKELDVKSCRGLHNASFVAHFRTNLFIHSQDCSDNVAVLSLSMLASSLKLAISNTQSEGA